MTRDAQQLWADALTRVEKYPHIIASRINTPLAADVTTANVIERIRALADLWSLVAIELNMAADEEDPDVP